MTDSERVILRVLAEEYEDAQRKGRTHPKHYGPYGRAGERCGVRAGYVAEIEDKYLHKPHGMGPEMRRVCILGVLDRGHC